MIFWKRRHEPQLINKRKIFSIELHENILRTKNYLIEELVDLSNFESMAIINILNFQINDYGYLYASYSYRTIFDQFKLDPKGEIIKKFENNKFIRKFGLITNELGITKYKLKLGVLTFNPLPIMFFNNEMKNYRLTNDLQKFILLKKIGVDFIINKRFNLKFSKINSEEKQHFNTLLRGAAMRILITRLHDQLFHPDGAIVIPKNPLEYFEILKWHQNNKIF